MNRRSKLDYPSETDLLIDWQERRVADGVGLPTVALMLAPLCLNRTYPLP